MVIRGSLHTPRAQAASHPRSSIPPPPYMADGGDNAGDGLLARGIVHQKVEAQVIEGIGKQAARIGGQELDPMGAGPGVQLQLLREGQVGGHHHLEAGHRRLGEGGHAQNGQGDVGVELGQPRARHHVPGLANVGLVEEELCVCVCVCV